jgi:hypothetical protein
MLIAAQARRGCAAGLIAWAAALAMGCAASSATASEGGASFYLPGLGVPMAGFLPPPGVYFDNTVYFYQGKLTGGRNTEVGGNVVAGVKVDAKVDFAPAYGSRRPRSSAGILPSRSQCPSASPRCGLAP